MKSDDEIVAEIMEAGWGVQRQPGIVRRGMSAAVKGLAKAAYNGAAKVGDAARDGIHAAKANPSRRAQKNHHANLRRDVLSKLEGDYDNWCVRTTGKYQPVTVPKLKEFAEDEYGYDVEPFIRAARAQLGMAGPGQKAAPAAQAAPQAAPQAQPAATPAASAPAAQAAPQAAPQADSGPIAPLTPAERATIDRAKARKAAADAPAAQKKPASKKEQSAEYDKYVHPDLPHRSLGSTLSSWDKDHAEGKPASRPRRTHKESIDLTKSFSEIIMEANESEDQQKFKQAFFNSFANYILKSYNRAQNFVQTSTISDKPAAQPQAQQGGQAAQGQAAPQAQAAQQKAAAPAQPAAQPTATQQAPAQQAQAQQQAAQPATGGKSQIGQLVQKELTSSGMRPDYLQQQFNNIAELSRGKGVIAIGDLIRDNKEYHNLANSTLAAVISLANKGH